MVLKGQTLRFKGIHKGAQYGPTSMRAGCNAIEKDAPGAPLFNYHIFQMAIGHQRQMEKLSPR